ncbi:MAG: energy-coupled thiamine transporter ThiT [Firmicutes bacterium]|nr:energy-coupled thiamine transporter ThiT [Bacillota bacterium]
MANNTKNHLQVRALTEGAVMVAAAVALSFVKVVDLPNGGSINLSAFPLILYAVRWGVGQGLLSGLVFGLINMLLDGAVGWGWQCIILDYMLAFSALGLAGLFKGKSWGVFAGAVVGNLGRFVFHYISGVTLWRIVEPTAVSGLEGLGTFSSPSLYSIVYNGSYMLPNLIITVVIAAFLYNPMKSFFAGNDIH